VRQTDGPFTSLQDFCARVDLTHVNKRMMENLIKGGAFDSLEGSKRQKLIILDTCLEQGHEIRKSKASAQISLFDFGEETGLTSRYAPIPLPNLPEFEKQELLAMEKEILGLYVSGHPLDDYKQVIHEKTSVTIAELNEEYDQQKVIVAGMIENFKISTTKKGDTMATVQFEDLTGNIDMLVFPKPFVRFREMIQKDAIVLVKGRYLAQDDNPKLSAEEILPLPNDAVWKEQQKQQQERQQQIQPTQPQQSRTDAGAGKPQGVSLQEIANQQPKKLYLRIAGDHDTPQVKQQLSQILHRYHGEMPVYFYFSDRKSMILAERQYWVNNDIDLIMLLSQLLGAENISVKDTK
jgi:DNA polymerase-3 subunit alpha